MKIRSQTILLVFLSISIRSGIEVHSQDLRQSSDVAYKRGLLHLQRGDIDAAERSFQTILQQDDKNARGHFGMGLVYTDRHPKSRRARLQFERAVELDSSFAEAWFQLAISHASRKRLFNKSREAFLHAMRLNPNLPGAWEYWIGKNITKPTALFDDFYEVLKQHPHNTNVYHYFITTTLKTLEEKRAAQMLERLRLDFPKNQKFACDWIRMLNFSEQYKKCSNELETIRDDSLCSATFFHRLQALNYFALKDTARVGILSTRGRLDSGQQRCRSYGG